MNSSASNRSYTQSRPFSQGCVIGLSLGKSAYVGGGVALLIAAMVSVPAWASPRGGRVERGNATIVQRGKTTVIRAGDRSVINYDQFDVAGDETVRFVQPSATSKVLNRVSGADPSRIDGTVRSNGIVYIVNPAGVFFGRGALVDVGQISAAAGNLSTRDFVRGNDHFTNVQGEVVNQGRISAGVVALIGDRVSNAGSITSENGVIAMVSGNDVVLNERGGTMSIKVAPGQGNGGTGRTGDPSLASVENTGLVDAGRGRTLMVAGDMASLAIKNSGTVRGKNVKIDSRGDGIVEVGGTVSARNRNGSSRGGTVTITGDRIALIDANIDASGRLGGGTVRVGGDALGQGTLNRATSTQVNTGTSIKADAVQRGEGGDVVVWSDRNTGFYGAASARGGAAGGNGGFVETSGKQTVTVSGARVRADAASGSGRAGTWLLDPFNVTISNTATTGGTFGGGNPNIFTPVATSNVLNTDLNTALSTGTTVEIRTGGAGGAVNDGNITVGAAITKNTTGTSTLILRAANDINVNAAISTASGPLNVQLLANNSQGGNVDNNASSGSVTFTAPGTVTTGGGTFNSSGIGFNGAAGATITTGGANVTLDHTGTAAIAGAINAGAGAVSVTASDVNITAAVTGNGGIVLAPASAGQSIAVNDAAGSFSVSSTELAQLDSTGTVTVGGASAGAITVGSAGATDLSTEAYNLTLQGASINFNNTIRGADNRGVSLVSAGDIGHGVGAGPDVRLVGSGSVTFASGGDVDLRTDAPTFGGSSASGTLTLVNTQGATFAGLSSGGAMSVTALGFITGTGAVTSGGAATFLTRFDGGAGVTLNNTGNSFLTLTARSRNSSNNATAAGAISVRESGATNLQGLETGGTASITSTGAITQGASGLTVGGGATFTTLSNTGAAITLNTATNTFGTLTARARDAADAADAAGNIGVTQTGTMTLLGASTTGSITLTSADIAISTTGGPNVVAGSGLVSLRPLNPNSTIGINDAAGAYGLSVLELQQISTTGLLEIGALGGAGAVNIGSLGAVNLSGQTFNLLVQGGAITFNNALTLANDSRLVLIGGAMTSAHAGVDVTVGGAAGEFLALSEGGVNLKTDAAEIAGSTSVGNFVVTSSRGAGVSVTTVRTTDGVTNTGGGDVTITGPGAVVIDQAVSASGAGRVTVRATGATGSVAVNAGVTTDTGEIQILGESGITFSAPGDVTSTSGFITAVSNFSNLVPASTITIADGALLSTGDSSAVTLRAGGDIAIGAGSAVNVRASRLNATSQTGTVGAGNSLRSEVFGAVINAATGIDLTNARNLAADLVTTAGAVRVNNTGQLSTFDNAWTGDSFDITATERITFGRDVTAGTGTIAIASTGGDVVVADTRTVRTTNAALSLTALDVNLLGSLSSGTAAMSISRSAAGGIGLGDATGDLRLSKAELSRITSDALTIGGTNITEIGVENVAATDVANIGEVILNATGAAGAITFGGVNGNVFRGVTANANGEISVNSNITASERDLALNADADGSAGTSDTITFAAGVVLTTLPAGGGIVLNGDGFTGEGALTLTSNQEVAIGNSLSASGPLVISAKTGITLNGDGSGAPISLSSDDGLELTDNLSSSGGNVALNADADADGTGLFRLASGRTITTGNGNLSVTAADVQLDGSVNAGTGIVSFGRANSGSIGLGTGFGDLNLSGDEIQRITGARFEAGNALTTFVNVGNVSAANLAGISTLVSLIGSDIDVFSPLNTGGASLAIARGTAGTIGLGNATGDMTISSSELSNISTVDLTIGSGSTGSITVNGVNVGTNLAGVSGLTTLSSTGTVIFASNASSFRSLVVNADNGVTVNTNLTTTSGDLSLSANANNTVDGNDGIAIFANRTISSAGVLSLTGSGGITSVGAVTLEANSGVTINNDVAFEGLTTINADRDGSGGGALTVAASSAFRTNGNQLNITAADLNLDGSINVGAGAITIRRSSLGTIGLGTATGNMTISGAELGRIVATGLTLGGSNTSGITVAGVSGSNSNGIAGTFRMESLASGGIITFDQSASTFNSLTALASSNITVTQALTIDSGGLFLDAGANTASVNDGLIALAASITIPNTQNLTMNSPVELRRNITLNGNDVTFASRINSGSGAARALVVNTSGNGRTTFGGDIGQNRELLSLTTNRDGRTFLGGNVRVSTGALTFGDGVTLTRNVTLRSDSQNSGVFFNSALNSDTDATPRDLTIITANSQPGTAATLPVISFAGNVGSRSAIGQLNLNYEPGSGFSPRVNVPRVATIIARRRDNNGNILTSASPLPTFRIVTADGLRMGRNEKFAVAGDLDIQSGGAVVLGDVTTLGDFRVSAPSIVLQRRNAGFVLGNGNTIALDRGVDYVAGGVIDFNVSPTVTGSGGIAPTFATPNGSGDANSTLNGFLFQAFGDVTIADLSTGTGSSVRTFDLRGEGPTNTNFAESIAGAIPRESRQNDVGQSTQVGQAQAEELKQLGIIPRNPTAGELIEFLQGAATYDDRPQAAQPAADDFKTVVTRLPSSRVSELLRSYDQLFNKPSTDEATGAVTRTSRIQDIQTALAGSVKRYRDTVQKTGDIDPVLFRRFLESGPAEAESLGNVRQMKSFLTQLELLGLTTRELNVSKNVLLNPVRPRGIRTVQQLEAIIRADTSTVALR